MSKLILLVGLSGSGKSTYAKNCLEHIDNISYLKTVTTRPYRTEQEKDFSFEYDFVSEEEYQSKKNSSKKWDHDEIHGKHYGLDLSSLETNSERNYLLNVYPDKELVEKIVNSYPIDVKIILIDTTKQIAAERVSMERPAQEYSRPEQEKNIELEDIRKIADYIFTPENILEIDLENMNKLIKEIINK